MYCSSYLGYERTGLASTAVFGGADGSHPASGPRDGPASTYVNIYLTLDPPLSVPEPVKEKLECEESEQTAKAAERWAREMEAKYAHRKVYCTVGIIGSGN